ncbi:DUF692 domain-containing protein [Nitrospirillum viridazoti]|uniref:UPF0276 protein Y958_22825 n=1 Tax=Nitrospirillum viridazoti CBAmc TaxID=1441467 RepID=A0A248K047_9PROT|nr:DUF692 domain-containing protein [Nitrospirillum amazonense]ASG23804.1 hypothetical protein Y958_22825 [Nitrospirillum amazonense CBAmc]TWB44781.1 hypothetical protein FBZ91_101252 [Nitrospirillum amazonense]
MGITGIGLKARHTAELLARRPSLRFLEVHAENYMSAGGPAHRWLTALREAYPVSIHGVGLSLGGAEPLDADHLADLAALVDRYQPELVSEHLAWCRIDGTYLNDLLPIPYTDASLSLVADHIDQTQTALRRRILVENPSSYTAFPESDWDEAAFLAELARRTGCGILLDVNNIHVSAHNVGLDARAYLAALPAGAVGEIHVAGHEPVEHDGRAVLLDTHGAPVTAAVWDLYRQALTRFGPIPTLVERDANIPPLAELLAEAATADGIAEVLPGKDGAHAHAA